MESEELEKRVREVVFAGEDFVPQAVVDRVVALVNEVGLTSYYKAVEKTMTEQTAIWEARMGEVEVLGRQAGFTEGYLSGTASTQSKAHPYAWAIKGPGIKADEMGCGGPESPEVDPEHEVRSAARREAFEALRNIIATGAADERIAACKVALETNQW